MDSACQKITGMKARERWGSELRAYESSEKMNVDEIAGRLQTCAFNETSVPKLGMECTGGCQL
jgi:hypothetical protein